MMDSVYKNWTWADKSLNRWILTVVCGVLLSISWPINGFPFLIFIALFPLLILNEKLGKDKGKLFFLHTYTALLIWNVLTTWWVYNSTPVALFAFTANAALQYIPIFAFRMTWHRAGKDFAYISLPIYWIAFEYLHLSWQLSWPWLTLGNVFSEYPSIVQWYEFTGVLGGSLWILILNICIFIFIDKYFANGKKIRGLRIAYIFFLLAAPIIESISVYHSLEEKGEEFEVVVVQPNIDPYNQKFKGSVDFIPFEQQIDRLIELSESKITAETQLVMWPETAIDNQFDEEALDTYPIIQKVRDFRNRHPQISLLTGLTTFKFYPKGVRSFTGRYAESYDLYYDVFNTALFINQKDEMKTYHKSKLVPGVEIMPYPSIFGLLQKVSINIGGTSGGFGRQNERTVFKTLNGTGLAPAICYESIYGDFLSGYMRNEANFIAIITNDGWWGNTAGYKQHNSYARLRAIEFRRDIARSANTGISGFINSRGEEFKQTEYWVKDVASHKIHISDEMTFFAEWGAYLGRSAGFIGIFMLLSAFVKGRTTLKRKANP